MAVAVGVWVCDVLEGTERTCLRVGHCHLNGALALAGGHLADLHAMRQRYGVHVRALLLTQPERMLIRRRQAARAYLARRGGRRAGEVRISQGFEL